jgi:hypothetical protein
MRVEILQSFGVGKFGEGAIIDICGKEWAGADAKNFGAERSCGIAIFFDGGQGGRRLDATFNLPGIVASTKCVAIGIAQERGAIVDFLREILIGTKRLEFGDEDEAAAKGVLIGRGIETEEIGSAVGVMIAEVGRSRGKLSAS